MIIFCSNFFDWLTSFVRGIFLYSFEIFFSTDSRWFTQFLILLRNSKPANKRRKNNGQFSSVTGPYWIKDKMSGLDLASQISSLSPAQKDQLMTEVRQQYAVANAQELITVNILLSIIIFFEIQTVNDVMFYCRKSQKNVSANALRSLAPVLAVLSKNAWPCVWIVSWTHSI